MQPPLGGHQWRGREAAAWEEAENSWAAGERRAISIITNYNVQHTNLGTILANCSGRTLGPLDSLDRDRHWGWGGIREEMEREGEWNEKQTQRFGLNVTVCVTAQSGAAGGEMKLLRSIGTKKIHKTSTHKVTRVHLLSGAHKNTQQVCIFNKAACCIRSPAWRCVSFYLFCRFADMNPLTRALAPLLTYCNNCLRHQSHEWILKWRKSALHWCVALSKGEEVDSVGDKIMEYFTLVKQ